MSDDLHEGFRALKDLDGHSTQACFNTSMGFNDVYFCEYYNEFCILIWRRQSPDADLKPFCTECNGEVDPTDTGRHGHTFIVHLNRHWRQEPA